MGRRATNAQKKNDNELAYVSKHLYLTTDFLRKFRSSIRDLLLTMTANQVVPLLDWLNEERRTLIEERVGYSE